MYAQEQSKNLWKVEPKAVEKESRKKAGAAGVVHGASGDAPVNPNPYRSVPFLEKKKNSVYFYNGDMKKQRKQNKGGVSLQS